MQFIERNQVVMGIITLAIILAAAAAALTLQRSDLTGGITVTAEFSDANGLRTGDVVVVAGARMGRVRSIEIVDDHVEVGMQMEDVELPVGTRATITPRTLVGKRAVELDTGRDFSKLLEDGDTIPLSQTVVYTDVPEFGKASDDLLSNVDAEALNTFLQALTDLTKGQRDEVAQLVEGGTRLTSVVNEQERPIRELLRQLRDLGATLNSRDKELVKIIDDFDVVLNRLAQRRADIRRLFEETRSTAKTSADLVAEIRPELDAVLTEVHKDIAILDRHQMDLAEALAYAPDSIGGFSSISFAGEAPVPYGHVLVQGLGPAGVDAIAGCGGLIDQQLDQLLGPDPRSCKEQEQDTFPDDTPPPDENDPVPDLPDPPVLPDLPISQRTLTSPQGRVSVDDLARWLIGGEAR